MRRERWAGRAALTVLVLIGAALRLYNLNWDHYQHVHPDERFIVWVADTISWPSSLAAAVNPATSTIDPLRWPPSAGELAGTARDYAYGHFPLYLLVLVGHVGQAAAERLSATGLAAVGALKPWLAAGRILAGYDGLALAGRVISALCDLGTLLLVYFLVSSVMAAGRPPRQRQVAGLLAAAAYTFAVLPIQLSHFYGVDLVMTVCVTASVLLAALWADRGGRWTWVAAGVLAGLAVGSKFSAILVVCPLAMAAIVRDLTPNPSPAKGGGTDGATGNFSPPLRGEGPGVRFRSALRSLGVAALAAAAAFFITNPFALIEPGAYLTNLFGQSAMVSGAMDAPYTRQFIGTAPYWYFIQQLSQWGLGWPLGVVAWAGFVWAVARAGLRRLTRGQLVLVAWALPYFAFTGAFYAKFLRYMAPLLPFLLVFAAGMGLAGWDWMKSNHRAHPKLLWGAACSAATVVLLFTIGWALTFMGVYRGEHPWLQASRWIYAHVPAGSTILTEAWDDALPLTFDGPDGPPVLPEYRRVEMPLYDEDTPAKLNTLADQLADGNYLVIASNRLARPISRLTARYPMSSQYYRLLAAGALGYQPVVQFFTYPSLGGLTVPDDNADESFTVYDHPHATVYANTGHLSAAALRGQLARYLPEAVQPRGTTKGLAEILRPAEVRGQVSSGSRPQDDMSGMKGLLGLGSRPQDDVASVAAVVESAIRSPQSAIAEILRPAEVRGQVSSGSRPQDDMSGVKGQALLVSRPWDDIRAVVLWWFAVGLFGWLAWPLLFPLLRGLADRGYGVARIAGWLLVGWVHWLAVSLGLWENGTAAMVGVLIALAVAGLAAAYVQRRALLAFWRAHRSTLLLIEGVFALAFVFFVLIRLLDPDLWQPWNGGEKFMEFAFLNAILRSPHFPPYDPYFAGGTINYYYFGLYLVTLPIRLTGIAPSVAFNLAIPGLFALTATAIFSIALTLRGAARSVVNFWNAVPAALLAVFFAVVMGNLDGFWQIMRNLAGLAGNAEPFLARWIAGVGQVLHGAPFPGYDYWSASRVIPFTINEFPYWTFLFADMHPHLIDMPLGMLVVGLALNWVMDAATERAAPARRQAAGEPAAGKQPLEAMPAAERVAPEPPAAIAPPANAVAAETSLTLVPVAAPLASETPALAADIRDRFAIPLARFALLVVALGSLGATNTWDLPVYAVLVAGAFLLAAWRASGRSTASDRVVGLVSAGLLAVGAVALGVLAYWPFYANYHVEFGGGHGSLLSRYLAPINAASPLDTWFLVWGAFLIMAYALTLYRPAAPLRRSLLPYAVALIVGAVLWAAHRPTAALAAFPLVLAVAALLVRSQPAEMAFSRLLLALGLGIVAGIELVYLRDFLDGGDWYRMNTVFKFAMPAWLFLGIACAALAVRPHPPAPSPRRGGGDLPDAGASFGVEGERALVPSGEDDGREVSAPAAAVREGISAQSGGGEDMGREDAPPPFGGEGAGGRGLSVLLTLVIATGLCFPIFGTRARVNDRFPGPRPPIGTLDGMAYMTVGRYNWPDDSHTIQLSYDYEAIRWLQAHVTGHPVVAEAPAGQYEVAGQSVGFDYYRAGGLRVSSMTGLPTFVGQHQYEQRDGTQVAERTYVAQQFFQTTNPVEAWQIIQELDVRYIYIGQLERILFSQASLAKFDQMVASGRLAVVYRNPQVTIYAVK